jgi:hypothetical protein
MDFLVCSIIPVFVTCFLVGGWLDRQQSERERERERDGEYCCGTGIKILYSRLKQPSMSAAQC